MGVISCGSHVLTAQAPAPTQHTPGQKPTPPTFEESIEVVGATPIHGLGVGAHVKPRITESSP
jgi:hypothetical protein